MQYINSFNNNTSKLFLIYFVNYVFYLINYQGIYWDDWTLYNMPTESMLSQFKMNGFLPAGYLHSILLSVGNGVFIYRLLSFIAFFLSGIFIYKVLKQHIFVMQNNAFWIVLAYLTIPVNSAKLALINVPYTLLLFSFFAAFYLLTEYISKKKTIVHRAFILLLFFMSFFMNSLLVFYTMVLLYLLYSTIIDPEFKKSSEKTFYLVKNFIFKYLDFIFLPIIFYIFKNIYFMPNGLYANYNKINFDLEKNTTLIIDSIKTSIYDPILSSIYTSFDHWYFTIIIAIFISILVYKKNYISKSYFFYILVFSLGMYFYFLAVFPYAVVNKLPQLAGFESRHQILMPLGIAFIIYALTFFLAKIHKNISILIFSILITLFTIQNIYNGYRYLKDWYYQISLEENFKSSATIKSHTTFIVYIHSEDAFANGREPGFYEQNGRLKKVFGNDKRLMVKRSKDIEIYKKYKNYKQYGFSSWEYEKPINIIISDNHMFKNQTLYFLKMLYYQINNKQVFRTMAKELITIKTEDRF